MRMKAWKGAGGLGTGMEGPCFTAHQQEEDWVPARAPIPWAHTGKSEFTWIDSFVTWL